MKGWIRAVAGPNVSPLQQWLENAPFAAVLWLSFVDRQPMRVKVAQLRDVPR